MTAITEPNREAASQRMPVERDAVEMESGVPSATRHLQPFLARFSRPGGSKSKRDTMRTAVQRETTDDY